MHTDIQTHIQTVSFLPQTTLVPEKTHTYTHADMSLVYNQVGRNSSGSRRCSLLCTQVIIVTICSFSAMTLLLGRQEQHLVWKK